MSGPSVEPTDVLPRNVVLVGDALTRLATLPSRSVDSVLTSPPYYRLRDYGNSGQLGAEDGINAWVDQLRRVARQLARVLVPTGTLWLNLGDSYAARERDGAPRKSLLLGPERLALALVADGWLLRNKIVWAKPGAMPTSVADRFRCSWEVVYLLTRSPSYCFDLDSLRLPHTTRATPTPDAAARRLAYDARRGTNAAGTTGLGALKAAGAPGHPLGKNPGDVWTLTPSRYRGGDHPAMFPATMATRAIQAGTPEARCSACRAPHRRQLLRAIGGSATRGRLKPTCTCDAADEPGVVLDPFMGSGTTALAAEKLHRDWLGIELNPAYVDLTERRLQAARGSPLNRAA